MTKINISEFSHYDSKAIYEFIMLQNETAFEISIPKKTIALKDDNFIVFSEYYQVAYAGQKLFEIADSFAYFVPCPYKNHSFVFEVVVNDMEKLADLVYLFVNYFYDWSNEEMGEDFDMQAAEFYVASFEDDIEVNTWGLISIAGEYLVKSG